MALPFGLKTGLTAKTIATTAVDANDPAKGNEEVEWSARCLAHAIVYQKNGKPIKTDLVPEAVKEQLIGTMLAGAGATTEASVQEPELPAEVQHEIDSVEEEPTPPSLNVTDEVSTIDEEALRVADEIIAKQTQSQVTMATTPASPNPFYGQSELEKGDSIEDNLGFNDVEAPKIDYEELLQEAEARSVDNANLKMIVDALYRRFRIYLPYINQPPQRSDISPTTGMVMNAITYGQAVQGFKTAQRTGASWNPAVMRSQIESARGSSQDAEPLPPTPEEQVQSVQPWSGQEVNMPNLHGEPEQPEIPRELRKFMSPHKSAVKAHRGRESDGLDPDEVYAEPPINAQTAIIRPFYPNKKSQAKLEEINRQRSASVQHNVGFDTLV